MEIEEESYSGVRQCETGSYIHRYYLPQELRSELQPQDMAVLYQQVMLMVFEQKNMDEIHALMLAGPCCIRYQIERIVKEIPASLLVTAIDACLNYQRERWDFSLTEEETKFLIALNERLRKLEDDINIECYRLNRDLLDRQAKGEPFLDDYEIDVELQFCLREDHPLHKDDDNNIIYEIHRLKTARSDDLEGWFKNEHKKAEGDWTDTRGATNPAIRNNPLFNVPHCQLFHDLQFHSPVPLKHLCGIGTIWVDIKILQQASFKIDEI